MTEREFRAGGSEPASAGATVEREAATVPAPRPEPLGVGEFLVPVTVQLLFALKSADPTALTAAEAIRTLLGHGKRLVSLQRRQLYEMVFAWEGTAPAGAAGAMGADGAAGGAAGPMGPDGAPGGAAGAMGAGGAAGGASSPMGPDGAPREAAGAMGTGGAAGGAAGTPGEEGRTAGAAVTAGERSPDAGVLETAGPGHSGGNGGDGSPSRSLLDELVAYLDRTATLWNPNKQRGWIRLDGGGGDPAALRHGCEVLPLGRRKPSPFGQPPLEEAAADHLLVWSRGQDSIPPDLPGALAGWKLLACGRGDLYTLRWADPPRGEAGPEQRDEWTDSVAAVRSRTRGLLVNPHYQDHRRLRGAVPLPLWGG